MGRRRRFLFYSEASWALQEGASGPHCLCPHLCKTSCPSQPSPPTAHFGPCTAASHSLWTPVPSCWGCAVNLWHWKDGDETPSMGWLSVLAFLCSFPITKLLMSCLSSHFAHRDTFAVSCLTNQWRRVISPACPVQPRLLAVLVPAKGWVAHDTPKCFS